jgi:hypothetical protein
MSGPLSHSSAWFRCSDATPPHDQWMRESFWDAMAIVGGLVAAILLYAIWHP